MTPGKNLGRLLAGMQPSLAPEEFVFCTFGEGGLPHGLEPLGTFREAEGLTAICERGAASEHHLESGAAFRRITLNVHSSLEAVGFLATVSRALADAGIPCNAVSAFHHDHLFVPARDAEKALAVLQRLAGRAGSGAR